MFKFAPGRSTGGEVEFRRLVNRTEAAGFTWRTDVAVAVFLEDVDGFSFKLDLEAGAGGDTEVTMIPNGEPVPFRDPIQEVALGFLEVLRMLPGVAVSRTLSAMERLVGEGLEGLGAPVILDVVATRSETGAELGPLKFTKNIALLDGLSITLGLEATGLMMDEGVDGEAVNGELTMDGVGAMRKEMVMTVGTTERGAVVMAGTSRTPMGLDVFEVTLRTSSLDTTDDVGGALGTLLRIRSLLTTETEGPPGAVVDVALAVAILMAPEEAGVDEDV